MSENITETVTVIRRCGEETKLDINRIREVINWSCKGLDVDPILLESHFTTTLKNGVTTREIQENLIISALNLCSLEESDWRYVAGRLHVWGLHKDVLVSRGYGYDGYDNPPSFSIHIKDKVDAGVYENLLLEYSEEELDIAGTWINEKLDKDYDFAGAILLTKRYLLPNELPQEAFLVVALLLALPEGKSEERLIWAKKFYDAISTRKISLATPILANLRVPNGNLSSCFISAMDDDLESIFATITDAARISKNGGGVGINLSRIRATGSWVMGNPNAAKGVVSWIKLLNDTALAVDQGGKRSGAFTVGIDIWHIDIPEFIEMQTESGSDLRRKCFDVFPQLVIPDEFMRRVRSGDDFHLVDPYEVRTKLGIELAELWGEKFESKYFDIELAIVNNQLELYKKVNARNLFKEIMRVQLETGLPYLVFKDTINIANPNKHEGYIPQANLCVESFSNVSPTSNKVGETHCCNLVSVNLANVDANELEDVCTTSVRLLDNTIDMTVTPTESSESHNKKYRTIGVGIMGLADYLALRKKSYRDFDFIDNLFEDFGYYCTKASMELAKTRGSFGVFEGSEWSKGLLMNSHTPDWVVSNAYDPQRFLKLADDIKKYGIRNSHITAVAPNTSSSLVQGCTASVLPTYSRFFHDKWTKGNVPVCPPYIKDKRWYYEENKYLGQQIVIRAVSAMQKWIDTGISMELLFNLNEDVYQEGFLTAKDIFNTLVFAWEMKCKAVYYVRTIQKDNYKELSKNECSSCAN